MMKKQWILGSGVALSWIASLFLVAWFVSDPQSKDAQKVHRGHKEHKEHKGEEGHQDHKGHKDHEEHKGHSVHAKHKEHKEHQEHKGHKGHESHKGHKEHKGHKGHESHKGHKEHKGHKGEEGHPGHEGHKEGVVQLRAEDRREFGVVVGKARGGALRLQRHLTGEISLNADRVSHLVPRLSGVVHRVRKHLGDKVRRGEVLAVLRSRELSSLMAAYLAARQRLATAKTHFQRVQRLRKKKITSEHEYLQDREKLVQAQIALRSAKQALYTLGYTERSLGRLSGKAGESLSFYRIRAPFAGRIIKKRISLGEKLKDDTEVFVVADLRQIWVSLRFYQKDLPYIRPKQEVVVRAGEGELTGRGRIFYISATIDESTRTGLARVALPNAKGDWRPGMFVTAWVSIRRLPVALRVPLSALQRMEGRHGVFVETKKGFVFRPVRVGRKDATHAEIKAGLRPGERFVTRGGFTLKSQLQKGQFGHSHSH